jgi:hypothetical protein
MQLCTASTAAQVLLQLQAASVQEAILSALSAAVCVSVCMCCKLRCLVAHGSSMQTETVLLLLLLLLLLLY